MDLRVLFVASRLDQRGSSYYTLNLARELVRARVDVCVVASGGALVDLFRREGVRVEVFSGLERPLFAPIQMKRLEALAVEFDPHVIHLQNRRVLSAGRRLSRLSCKIMVTVHVPARTWRQSLHRLKRLDRVIATSQSVREDLVNDEKTHKDLITVIPPCVDLRRFDGRSVRPLFSEPTRLIGAVGPVEEGRGQEHFIKAIPFVLNERNDVQFLVVGDGAALPRMRRLASSLGLQGRVTFVTDLARYVDVMEALDVVVYTALEDVSAFSLLEGMAWGRPVVAFSTPSVCSIIEDGRTGLLVPRGDARGVAEAVLRLLDNEKLALAVGRAGQEVIRESYNAAVVAKKTMQVYAEVCGVE